MNSQVNSIILTACIYCDTKLTENDAICPLCKANDFHFQKLFLNGDDGCLSKDNQLEIFQTKEIDVKRPTTCIYCDTKLSLNDKICPVCEAEVKLENLSFNIIKSTEKTNIIEMNHSEYEDRSSYKESFSDDHIQPSNSTSYSLTYSNINANEIRIDIDQNIPKISNWENLLKDKNELENDFLNSEWICFYCDEVNEENKLKCTNCDALKQKNNMNNDNSNEYEKGKDKEENRYFRLISAEDEQLTMVQRKERYVSIIEIQKDVENKTLNLTNKCDWTCTLCGFYNTDIDINCITCLICLLEGKPSSEQKEIKGRKLSDLITTSNMFKESHTLTSVGNRGATIFKYENTERNPYQINFMREFAGITDRSKTNMKKEESENMKNTYQIPNKTIITDTTGFAVVDKKKKRYRINLYSKDSTSTNPKYLNRSPYPQESIFSPSYYNQRSIVESTTTPTKNKFEFSTMKNDKLKLDEDGIRKVKTIGKIVEKPKYDNSSTKYHSESKNGKTPNLCSKCHKNISSKKHKNICSKCYEKTS